MIASGLALTSAGCGTARLATVAPGKAARSGDSLLGGIGDRETTNCDAFGCSSDALDPRDVRGQARPRALRRLASRRIGTDQLAGGVVTRRAATRVLPIHALTAARTSRLPVRPQRSVRG
jgi:hypothetical protein